MGGRSKYTFIQRKHSYDQKAHEKMLNILIIREMQVKTKMRYPHFSHNCHDQKIYKQ